MRRLNIMIPTNWKLSGALSAMLVRPTVLMGETCVRVMFNFYLLMRQQVRGRHRLSGRDKLAS